MRQFSIVLIFFVTFVTLQTARADPKLIDPAFEKGTPAKCPGVLSNFSRQSSEGFWAKRFRKHLLEASSEELARLGSLAGNSWDLKWRRLIGRFNPGLDGELYRLVFELVSKPEGLIKFYEKYLNHWAVEIPLSSRERESLTQALRDSEDSNDGRSWKKQEKQFQANVFSPATNEKDFGSLPAVLYLGKEDGVFENNLGLDYQDYKTEEFYVVLKNGKILSDVLRDVKESAAKTRSGQEFTAIVDSIMQFYFAGNVEAILLLSKGREVMSYGENAGTLSFFDSSTEAWLSQNQRGKIMGPGPKVFGLNSSSLYFQDGSPRALARAYPFESTTMNIAIKWVQHMERLFFPAPKSLHRRARTFFEMP